MRFREFLYRFFYFTCFVAISFTTYSQTAINLNCKPTIWANNKSSALSFSFDDGTANQFSKAMPLLNQRNFKATFNIITSYIDSGLQGVTWDTIRKAADFGHEIASHTVSHADLQYLAALGNIDSIKKEMLGSKNKIESNIKNQNCLTLAYPWTKHNYRVDSIARKYFIAGRSAGYLEDKFPCNFYGLAGTIIYRNTKTADLNNMVDYNIRWGDWLIEMWHGIDTGGWQPVPASTFDQHLSYVKFKESQVWVATTQDVVKYIQERQRVRLTKQYISNNTISFSANDSLSDSIYNYPVTMQFEIPTYFNRVDSIVQHNKRVKHFILNIWGRNYLYLNILPDTSKVTVFLRDTNMLKPVITVTGKKAPCYGDSIKLSAPASYRYYWSTGDSVRNIWVKKSGKYSLRVKSNRYSISDPADTVTVYIPPAIYTPVISSDKPPFICLGDSIRLSVTSGFKKYIWNGKSDSSDIYVKTAGTFKVYLIDSVNCQTRTSANFKVVVNSIPAPPVIEKVAGLSHCDGEYIQLSASPGFKKYLWNTGDVNQIISVGHSGKYTVQGIDTNNCTSIWSGAYSVPNLISFYHPKISVKSKSTECEGNPAVLEAPDYYMAYEWSDGSQSRILETQNGGKYFVRVFDNNLCPSGYSDTVDVAFLPRPLKPDVIIKGSERFCMGDSVVLSSPAWTRDITWSDSSHMHDLTVKKSGLYSMVMKDQNGCISPESDKIEVVVTEIPERPNIILNEDLTLQSSLSGNTYIWKLNDNDLNINSSTIDANKYGKGFYQLAISNSNCISEYSDIFPYFPLSVNQGGIENNFIQITSLTNGYIEIKFNKSINPDLIQMYNMNGKLTFALKVNGLDSTLKLNTGMLQPGEYILRVTSVQGIFSQKFVLQ